MGLAAAVGGLLFFVADGEGMSAVAEGEVGTDGEGLESAAGDAAGDDGGFTSAGFGLDDADATGADDTLGRTLSRPGGRLVLGNPSCPRAIADGVAGALADGFSTPAALALGVTFGRITDDGLAGAFCLFDFG